MNIKDIFASTTIFVVTYLFFDYIISEDFLVSTGIALSITASFFAWDPRDKSKAATIFILGLTATALVWGTQTAKQDTINVLKHNRRPTLMAAIKEDGSPAQFWKRLASITTSTIYYNQYDNIAQEISGYIVIDGQKWDLYFWRGTKVQEDNTFTCSPDYSKPGVVSWNDTSHGLCAYFNKELASSTSSESANQICILYKDTDGNKYFSRVSEDGIPLAGVDVFSGVCPSPQVVLNQTGGRGFLR